MYTRIWREGGENMIIDNFLVGCVADNTPKYLGQALRLLQSWRWFAGSLAGADFHVCVVGDVDQNWLQGFRRYGAVIHRVSCFDERHLPSNKLRLLELPDVFLVEKVILLDCDTLIVQEPRCLLESHDFLAKIADCATVSTRIWPGLFAAFAVQLPAASEFCTVSGEPTIPYFNAGVLAFSHQAIRKLVPEWIRINRELLDRLELLQERRYFCEQASLSLALASVGTPFATLGNDLNFPAHLTQESPDSCLFKVDPVIIHYHWLVDRFGFIEASPYPAVNARIQQFNARFRAVGKPHLDHAHSMIIGSAPESVPVPGYSSHSNVSTQKLASRLIVVLGMHRSGTSVLTRSLVVLGVHLGDSMIPGRSDNEKGFFEDIELNEINVELIDYLGFNWDNLKSIPDDEFNRPDLEPLRQRALAFLGKRRAEYPVSAIKDPRLCITLAFWQPLFQRAGFEVSYLIALRHPLSVQQSLSRRDGLAAEKCHYLWLKYMLASVSQTGGYPRCVVCYDRMMDEPEPQLLRMARHLNLSVQAEALPAFTETFLTESLRHTRFDPTTACHLATMPVDVVSTWTVLDRLARDEWAADDARVAESLHPVACKMRDVEPAFAYATALEQELIRNIRQRDHQQAEWKIRETEWQGIVDSYRHSTSWRITRPLRWLAGKSSTLRYLVKLIFTPIVPQ